MRRLTLYWKIFIFFWLTIILIIITTAWVTKVITKQATLPIHERNLINSYASAAVATFESGNEVALKRWLLQMGQLKGMNLFFLSKSSHIISNQKPPIFVQNIVNNLSAVDIGKDNAVNWGNVIISDEIISTSGHIYRLIAVSKKPLFYFEEISWSAMVAELLIALFISGLICYLLSRYLTKPLFSLRMAAKSIATGELSARVACRGHKNDEISKLSNEFNRMAEQVETIMLARERLLQDISHELRSPLSRLQIAIELGRKKASDLAELEFTRMELECLRLNSLIGEILEYARLEHAYIHLNKSMVDLYDLLVQIIEDANFELARNEPGVFLHANIKCKLLLDKRLVSRAIENIIRNALIYAAPTPHIEVFLTADVNKSQIYIDIGDNGPGLPEDQLQKIFDPFYRVDVSRTKNTGGYGLGLAIAQQAIKLHNGNISAMNRHENHGLLVRVALPVA